MILKKSQKSKLKATEKIFQGYWLFTYSIVRLPQSEINLAGETAFVFKTEHNGKPVYVISLEDELNCELKVAQPEAKSDIEARIGALEKEVFKAFKSKKDKWAR